MLVEQVARPVEFCKKPDVAREDYCPVRLRVLLIGNGPEATTLLRAITIRMSTTITVTHLTQSDSACDLGMEHDLVLLVLPLRGDDGVQLCHRLREQGLSAPILILDTSGQIDHVVAAFEAGADGYMIWPLNIEEVRARIDALMRRRDRSFSAG